MNFISFKTLLSRLAFIPGAAVGGAAYHHLGVSRGIHRAMPESSISVTSRSRLLVPRLLEDFRHKPIDRSVFPCYTSKHCRGIAQFGSALGSGPRGRRFKSCCSDHLCGCSSMVERQPSKLVTRVRFPSPAPFFYPRSERIFYWENR